MLLKQSVYAAAGRHLPPPGQESIVVIGDARVLRPQLEQLIERDGDKSSKSKSSNVEDKGRKGQLHQPRIVIPLTLT